MESPASVAAEYDPKTDPKRRPAKSNDPGWEYGYWADPKDRDKVTCKLCDKKVPGGIKRFKQHLAGGFGDVVNCPESSPALKKKMKDYLDSNKRRRPLFLGEEENAEEVQEEEDVVEVGQEAANSGTAAQSQVASVASSGAAAQSQVKVPSSGTAAKRRQSTLQFKAAPASKAKANPNDTKKSVKAMFRRTPEEIVDERRSGRFQKTIQNCMRTDEERHYVDVQWALFFYECGVPFHAAAARQFEVALEATAQYGSGYEPPSQHKLREPLLWEYVGLTSKMRVDHERAWKHYGCTLMSDGWTDMKGRHLINFLVNSPEGTYFLESVDASGEVHDAHMLADLLEKRIEGIGKDKVVQIITDNGANYKAAGKLLMDRIPTIFWSPCAAHCLDLMLEDIGKIKEFKRTIARAKGVANFIYRHGKILSLMREKTRDAEIVRPGATRFATSYLSLKSLHKLMEGVKALFTCPEWYASNLSKTKVGERVYNTVLSIEFWNAVEDCLRASAPLLIVLRAADGDEKPAMPEVAALMTEAKEQIKKSFGTQNKKGLLKKILDIIERRWLKQMDHPLYGAALYLNPGKLFPLINADQDETVGQLRACFLKVLRRMVSDGVLRNKINDQAMDYQCKRGEAFSDEMAIENIESKSPRKCCPFHQLIIDFCVLLSIYVFSACICHSS